MVLILLTLLLNRELELFKKFQIAAQANPKLTYVEFCKTINNE